MIERAAHVRAVLALLQRSPVVAIPGARQVGKTTLARRVVARTRGPSRIFDLEHDPDRAALTDPGRTLGALRGLVVLDEIQNLPEVFRTLRVLADRPRRPAGFLFKRTSAPVVTPSMRIAVSDLRLERLDVIHAGTMEFEMDERIRAVPLAKVLRAVRPLTGKQRPA